MAKLTANGNYKVGQITCYRGKARYVFALRSDGKVLSRLAGFYNDQGDYSPSPTAYKVYGAMKRKSEGFSKKDVERLADILSLRDFRVQEVK